MTRHLLLVAAKNCVISFFVCILLLGFGIGDCAGISAEKKRQVQDAARQFDGVYYITSHTRTKNGCDSQKVSLTDRERPFKLKAIWLEDKTLFFDQLIVLYLECDYNGRCEDGLKMTNSFSRVNGEWIVDRGETSQGRCPVLSLK